MTRLDRLIRSLLLRVRVMPIVGDPVPNPDSASYLFLVQQSKRTALSNTIGRFSRRNFLLWPFLILIVLMKYVDIVISNALIRSFINEMDLQRLALEHPKSDIASDATASSVSTDRKV